MKENNRKNYRIRIKEVKRIKENKRSKEEERYLRTTRRIKIKQNPRVNQQIPNRHTLPSVTPPLHYNINILKLYIYSIY